VFSLCILLLINEEEAEKVRANAEVPQTGGTPAGFRETSRQGAIGYSLSETECSRSPDFLFFFEEPPVVR
jgi:hypothetical protein